MHHLNCYKMNLFFGYLKNGKTFLATSGLFLIFSLLTLPLINTAINPLFSTVNHYSWLNVVMINITFMGDSFFVVLLSVYLILYKQKTTLGLKLLLGLLFTMFLVQMVNNAILFENYSIYMEYGQYVFDSPAKIDMQLPTIISSHTAVVFCWSTILSIRIKKSVWQMLFFFISIIVAFSRLYLAPHFFYHLITGATAGLTSGLFVYLLQTNILNSLKKTIRLLQLSNSHRERYTELQTR